MILVILHDAGYQTASVSDGKEAVKFAAENKADLILMDVHMPGMDGFTASREIRKLPDPLNKIPIVAITAQAVSGDKEKCIEAGMNDYISKPVSPRTLILKIDKCLGLTSFFSENSSTAEASVMKVLDVETLEQISLGNKEFLRDLLLTYIEDMETRLSGLSAGLRDNDMKKIILESHSIKGASLSIGANIVGEEAKAIEISGKCNDLESAKVRLPALYSAFKEAKQFILDYIE